ncbi:MAG: DNA repair protein RadA, partial [Bombilactobacillus sp.]|nr:DNA repair protein RadA [Bombilactobacillus sp.]
MAKIKTKYKCHSCGYISASYLGRCPNCGAWNQFEKETETVQARSTKGSPSRLIKKTGINEPVKITAVKAEKEERIKTSMG